MGTVMPFGYAVFDKVAEIHASNPFDFVLHQGDISYAGVDISEKPLNITKDDEFEYIWDLFGRQIEPVAATAPCAYTMQTRCMDVAFHVACMRILCCIRGNIANMCRHPHASCSLILQVHQIDSQNLEMLARHSYRNPRLRSCDIVDVNVAVVSKLCFGTICLEFFLLDM